MLSCTASHEFYMCKVVFSVPCVECNSLPYLNSTLARGIVINPVEILVCQMAQKEYPALVQCRQQFERHSDRSVFPVFHFSPQLLIVRFYNRSVFSNRQFHADIGVHVTVCEVMYNLSYGPAVLTIGFVESTFTELFDNFFQLFRKIRYLPDVSERIQV